MASELNISVCFCFILSVLGSPCLWTNGLLRVLDFHVAGQT